MEVYELKNNQAQSLNLVPFNLEKDIQELVEKNTESFFNVEFIKTEYTVGKYRIDSLCYDKENKSFVIIEYKKGKSYSVIDQGYTYLQLLLNNKSDFLLTLSQHMNKVLSADDIDWSQSKIIFVSPSYNSYQKDSVNFKNVPFELWEIKRFSNSTIALNKHQATSNESIESLSSGKSNSVIASVSREVKTISEEDHTSNSDEIIVAKWKELKELLDVFDDISIVPKKNYISLMKGKKTLSYFTWKKSFINIEISRGLIKSNGSKSKNFFNIDDPKKMATEYHWNWKDGTKGCIYKIKFDKKIDLDYLMILLKQKYKNLTS